MAKQPEKESVDKKSKVRRVKNPESFRERAVKVSNKEPRNKRLSPVGRVFSKVFGTLLKPFKVTGQKLGKNKFVKKLKKPARILAKILLISYFVGSFRELKLVTWPGWKQSRRLTYAVLLFAIVFGAVIAGLDWMLGKIFKEILIK